jgi:NAD(P)-dependent dehydrogenase (short-subunit alcohol dehydrogenase family)
MANLKGKIALVTGASRGVGRGIALGLGEAGATVYVTARSATPADDPRGSLTGIVSAIDALGGCGVAALCDHADDAQVERVFAQVRKDHGRLDVLVNNVMSTPQRKDLPPGARSQWDLHPFWEMPLAVWDMYHRVGLRSHYVASACAVPLMLERGGLIVHVSAPGAVRYVKNIAYGTGKAAIEKLSSDMAEELKPVRVTSVTLWPGFIRTEDVLLSRDVYPDLSQTSSPIYPGRAVAALAADPDHLAKTGTRLKIGDLAKEYGFTDPEPAPPAPAAPAP